MDTERSLHFNYSHQLSRKSYKQLSCADKAQYKRHPSNLRHTTIQSVWSCHRREPPPSLWSRRHCCGAATIVVDMPPLSSGCRHHRGAAAIVVEPPPASWSRRCRCWTLAVVVYPPPLPWSRCSCRGAVTIVVVDTLLPLSLSCCLCRGAAVVIVEPSPLSWSRRHRKTKKKKTKTKKKKKKTKKKKKKQLLHSHYTTRSKNLLHQRSHHADKAYAAQSHRPDTNLTQPWLRLILHLTRGITSLIKAQPLLKLNSTICSSCIFNFLPGLSHHMKRQPSVAPDGHAVCISYGI